METGGWDSGRGLQEAGGGGRHGPTPVMLRMLSAMVVGVTVPSVVSACRMRIMPSNLCSVVFRHERHTSSLLDTCWRPLQGPGPPHSTASGLTLLP